MKNPFYFAHLLMLTIFFQGAGSLYGQPASTPTAPLGLRRLKNGVHDAGKGSTIGGSVVDDLSATAVGVARQGKRNGISYLALEAGGEWFRPLLGNRKSVGFVSFQACASQATLIEIGAVKFGITASDVVGYAQLMINSGSDEWRPLGVHLPFARYDGKQLAALPVLTVRLDPVEGVFDIYADARLLADDLPLGVDGARKFVVTAGNEGAWITGLVQSDENPLFEDANGNGIDDGFEQKKGSALSRKLASAERKKLAAEWRMDQLSTGVPALFLNMPRPDGK